jgi:hypothetical protein
MKDNFNKLLNAPSACTWTYSNATASPHASAKAEAKTSTPHAANSLTKQPSPVNFQTRGHNPPGTSVPRPQFTQRTSLIHFISIALDFSPGEQEQVSSKTTSG